MSFELLYIYLDDYKNFTQKDFCFSPEFIFSTSARKKHIEIHVKHNPDFIPNFFENQNIVNVTAIIGQNGTGKSNVLEFIRTSLPEGSGGFTKECIVAVRATGSPLGEEGIYLFATPLIDFTLHDETKSFKKVILRNRKKTGPFTTNYSIDDIVLPLFINYSNIVDLKMPSAISSTKLESEEESSSTSGFRNISTMALLSQDQENYSNDPKIRVEKIDAYKSREFGRNIEFITSEFRDLLDFSLPEYLYVTVIDNDERNLKKDKYSEVIFRVLNNYDNTTQVLSNKQRFFDQFIRAVFFNLMRSDLQFNSISISEDYLNEAKGENFEGYFRDLLDKMKKPTVGDFDIPYLQTKADLTLQLIDFVYEYLIKTDPFITIQGREMTVAMPVSFEGKFQITEFIDLYVRSKNITDYLLFKWRSLSSGEQSMLTLVSRFYKLSQDLGEDLKGKSLAILLDEPDLYFHPEWQRTMLNNLLDYLPKLFPNRSMQLILTANTPYLVSDLPPANVIMMRNADGKLKVHNAHTINKATFASNIHTLLSEDFYVSNFIGEFAKKKIERLVEYLRSDMTDSYITPEIARKQIAFVGDPVIRLRLTDLFEQKFPNELEELRYKRARLLEELEEIDNQLENEDAETDND